MAAPAATVEAPEGDSMGLTSLKELVEQGHLASESAMQLRGAHARLLSAMRTAQGREQDWLNKARDLFSELEVQRSTAGADDDERAADDLVDVRTESGAVQRDLLLASNELMVIQSNMSELEDGYQRLVAERDELSEDVAYLGAGYSKAADPEVARLQDSNRELLKEVEQRNMEADNAQEELNALKTANAQLLTEEQEREARISALQQELTILGNQPTRLSKQASVAQTSINNTVRKLEECAQTMEALRQDLELQGERRESVQVAIDDCEENMLDMEEKLEEANRRTQQHEATLEQCRDASSTLQADRAMMETQLRHARREAKALADTVARQTKEKEQRLRELKHAEARQAAMQEACDNDRRTHEELKRQCEARRKENASLKQAVDRLDREMTVVQQKWETGNSSQQHAVAMVHDAVLENRGLERELQEVTKHSHELERQVRNLQSSVDQAGAERLRALQAAKRSQDTLLAKKMTLRDCHKSIDHMKRQLQEMEAIYNVIKGEKNTCLSQIQAAHQRLGEVRDKTRIVQTEMEILRASAVDKERRWLQAKAGRQTLTNGIDQLRVELNMAMHHVQEVKAKGKNASNQNQKLLETVAVVERDIIRLREEQKALAEQRNAKAQGVITRQEELAALYEHLNLNANAIREAEVQLNQREEDIRFLKMEAAESKRSLELEGRRMPQRRELQSQLVQAQVELAALQAQVKALEDKAQTPEASTRWRQLPGEDLTPAEIRAKLEELTSRLAVQEERLLEKDLVLQETLNLVDRAEKQVDGGRDDTLDLAKAVNDYQARVKDLTRKLMAMVSELSIYQAQSLQLQQDKADAENELQAAIENLSAGRPPNEDAEREWQRQERQLRQQAADRLSQTQQREHESAMLVSTIDLDAQGRTATQQRPTAYMPAVEGALPIPRPFGRYAPFRPAEPAPNLRHLRKSAAAPPAEDADGADLTSRSMAADILV